MDGVVRLGKGPAISGWSAVGAIAFFGLFLHASLDLFYFPPITAFQLFLLGVSVWRAGPEIARSVGFGLAGVWLLSLLGGLLPIFVEQLEPWSWLVLQFLLAHALWLIVLLWRMARFDALVARRCFYASLILLFAWLLLGTGDDLLSFHRQILLLESFSLVLGLIAFGRGAMVAEALPAWLIAVLLVQLPSTFAAVQSGTGAISAWRALEVLGHIAFAGCLLGWFRQDAKAPLWVAVGLAAMAIIYLIVVSVFWLCLEEPSMYDWFLNPPLFKHIRHIGYFLCPAIVLCLWAFLACEGRAFLLFWLAYVVASGLLLWSGGRGAFVASAAGVAFMLFAFRRLYSAQRLRWALIGLLVALLLAALFPVYDSGLGWLSALVRSEQASSINSFSTGRLRIWSMLWRMVLERPWFGWGGDVINELFARKRFVQAHNAFLQLLVEWGGAGLMVIGGGLATLLVKARFPLRSVDSLFDRRVLGGALVIALLALSMVDGVLYHAMPSVLLALGYAMLLSGRESEGHSGAIA